MKKFLLAASAAAVALVVAPAANAAEFVVSGGSLITVPDNNDFKYPAGGLGSLGLTKELIGAKVELTVGTSILFEILGSESGYSDSFLFDGTTFYTESNSTYPPLNFFGAPGLIDILFNPAGLFLASFSSDGSDAASASAIGGSPGFSVFVDENGGYNSGVLYFGYDDVPKVINGGDDNHDDLIIRATIVPVPEPATWALMLAGVAAVGVSMRRRSKNVRVAFS